MRSNGAFAQFSISLIDIAATAPCAGAREGAAKEYVCAIGYDGISELNKNHPGLATASRNHYAESVGSRLTWSSRARCFFERRGT